MPFAPRDGTKLSNRSELTVPGPAAANTPATGAPSISGTARVGETLTVDTSGIDDEDGLANVSLQLPVDRRRRRYRRRNKRHLHPGCRRR